MPYALALVGRLAFGPGVLVPVPFGLCAVPWLLGGVVVGGPLPLPGSANAMPGATLIARTLATAATRFRAPRSRVFTSIQ